MIVVSNTTPLIGLAVIERFKIDLLTKRSVERSHNPIRRQEILDTAEVIYGAQ